MELNILIQVLPQEQINEKAKCEFEILWFMFFVHLQAS